MGLGDALLYLPSPPHPQPALITFVAPAPKFSSSNLPELWQTFRGLFDSEGKYLAYAFGPQYGFGFSEHNNQMTPSNGGSSRSLIKPSQTKNRKKKAISQNPKEDSRPLKRPFLGDSSDLVSIPVVVTTQPHPSS